MHRAHLASEKRHCRFCRKSAVLDPENIDSLRHEIDHHGHQKSTEQTGNCSHHHHEIAKALKEARKTGALEAEEPLPKQVKHRPFSRKLDLDEI